MISLTSNIKNGIIYVIFRTEKVLKVEILPQWREQARKKGGILNVRNS